MEWQVEKFTGDGEELNSLLNLLLEEGVEEPKAIVSELESPAISLSCNDPEELVNWKNVKEENIDAFRRNFTGSGIYLEPGDFHFIFALPLPEYDKEPIGRYVHPTLERTLSEAGLNIDISEDKHDYSLKYDGMPLADMSMRKTSEAVVIPGFVSIEPWDAEQISDYLSLRNHQEVSYIENMPNLSNLGSLDREGYEEIFIEVSSEDGSTGVIEVPEDFESRTRYSDNGYHGPYTGFCPVVPDLLPDESGDSSRYPSRSLESE